MTTPPDRAAVPDLAAHSAESSGLELVVHHRYADGSGVDLSGRENHGYRVASSEASPFSTFDGAGTRVVVLPASDLTNLGAVRVRARMRLDRLGDRRTIMEGYLAFAFLVEPDGALTGSVYTDGRWDDVRTAPGAVELGRFVDVAFTYDGIDTALLSVDGAIVAARYVPLGRVGSVRWPYGISVGAWPDGDLCVFVGEIAEVWLWRGAR